MPRLGDMFSDEQKRKLGYNRGKERPKEKKQNRERNQEHWYLWGIDPSNSDSVSLILGKMKPFKIGRNYVPYDGDSKKKFLKFILEFYESKEEYSKRFLKSRIKVLRRAGFKSLKLKLVKRLIVGLGNSSVLETGITLHHIYGFPYIPASSVKGVVRDTALRKMFPDCEDYEDLDKKLSKLDIEKVSEKEKIFIRIFGSQNYKGEVVFADMIPDVEDFPELDLDVINVHYRKYYSKLYSNTKNLEWKEEFERNNPNPVFFLVVNNGSFILFYKSPNDLESEVEMLIEETLTEHGIGAKTRFGYGFFESLERQR